MLGQFLEISIHTPDIKASLGFYESLGFEQAGVGETWEHPYAVVSDGHLFVGLHQYDFQSPSLTYVHRDLKRDLHQLEALGVSFEFLKLDDDVFNEAGFLDPDGQIVTLLEARTYSPPAFERDSFSACGRFGELSMPSRSVETAVSFWERMGFVLASGGEKPFPWASLTGDRINLGFYETTEMRTPALTFFEPDMGERITRLRSLGFELSDRFPGLGDPQENAMMVAPEGTPLYLFTDD